MSEKPLTPWVVCENSGKVLSAHCDCMAGLGESCSHVASLLWAIEAGCKRRDSLTVTDKKAYWVLPTSVKTVPYARVKDINFSKTPCSTSTVKPSSVTPPSETELAPVAICYCRGGEHGQMVGCDNDDCPYQWFHLNCLKLKAFPKSKTWYCPECQKRRRRKYRVQRAD